MNLVGHPLSIFNGVILKRLVLMAWLSVTTVLGAIHLLTPPSPDSAIFDYMSWRVLSGDLLYVDVIEQNWPGAVWVHMVSTYLFGNTWWSYRLLDYLLMVIASVAMFCMGRRSGLRWTGALAAGLYPLMYVVDTPWVTGQRDALIAHLLLMAMALYLMMRGRWQPAGMAVLGLLFALVVMIRPTYLLFPGLLLLLELAVHLKASRSLLPFLRGAAVGALAFVTVLALVALHGYRTGGLQGWWESAILFNLSVYSGSAGWPAYRQSLIWTLQSWHWYLFLACAGALLWYRSGERWTWALLVMFVSTCVVSYVVQGKAFGYHLAGLLPVMALFVAHALAWSAQTLAGDRRQWWIVTMAALVMALALLGMARKARALRPHVQVLAGQIPTAVHLRDIEFVFDGMDMADLVNVADHVRAHTESTDTVLVWNRGIWINFLSERRMPIPFATVGGLAEFKSATHGLGQRWLNTLNQGLQCSSPVYVVVGAERGWSERQANEGMLQGGLPASDRLVLEALKSRYFLETRIGGAQLWRLASPRPSTCTLAGST